MCSTYNDYYIQRQFVKINCKLEKSLNVAETPGGNVGNESFWSSHVCSSTRTHGKSTDHPTRMQRRRERKNESLWRVKDAEQDALNMQFQRTIQFFVQSSATIVQIFINLFTFSIYSFWTYNQNWKIIHQHIFDSLIKLIYKRRNKNIFTIYIFLHKREI